MSWDSWTCLMVKKGPGVLDNDVRDTLKAAACNLQLRRVDRMAITNDVCAGIIQTEWKTHLLGTRSGVLFNAQVETDAGDTLVNFLLSTEDLESGAEIIREMEERDGGKWVEGIGRIPIPDLYLFRDLRRTSLH